MKFEDFFRLDFFRYDIINLLIQKYNFKDYLEIGVDYGNVFTRVNCENKISVDPENHGYTICQMTSDSFFELLNPAKKFDIIFIDGLHTYEQCYRDLENSIKHLSDNGFIICHDMNPVEKSLVKDISEWNGIDFWTGDVYKSFIKFRQNHYDEYKSCLISDCDWGIGVITKGQDEHISCDVDNLSFEEFTDNKQYLMNCISTEDFLNKLLTDK